MAYIYITMSVPEEYAETARAYVLEHIGIQIREQASRQALAPALERAEVALSALAAANALPVDDAQPETPASE